MLSKQLALDAVIQSLTVKSGLSVLLIGGCSRCGKSTLSKQLMQICQTQAIPSLAIQLDAWIVSLEKRPPHSSVLERFEVKRIVEDIHQLLQGQPIYPPVYDTFTRKRTQEYSSYGLQVKEGLLIIEGVIALAIEALVQLANLRIFVDLEHETRLERLYTFYLQDKGLTFSEAETVIETREREEVPFIYSTRHKADLIWLRDHFRLLNPDFVIAPAKPAS